MDTPSVTLKAPGRRRMNYGRMNEAGDGQQYTVQVKDPSKPDVVLKGDAEDYSAVVNLPVSKEDRLVDDVD